jgi:hypothetical protein
MWWNLFLTLMGGTQLKEMLDFREDQWHRNVIFVFQVLPPSKLNSKDARRLVPPGNKSCLGEVLAGGQRNKGGYWAGLAGGAARFPQDPHLEWPQEEVCRLRKLCCLVVLQSLAPCWVTCRVSFSCVPIFDLKQPAWKSRVGSAYIPTSLLLEKECGVNCTMWL